MHNFLWFHRYLLIMLFCLILPSVGMGEPSLPADNAPSYRLGPDDVVKISIMAGGTEQVAKEMVVGGTGHVTVPFVGKVMAQGLTLGELETAIVKPLAAEFFVDPQVHLQIVGYHSLKFFISGAVKNPGKFELDFIPTIMDLIAKAGGVLPERGNLAYILRGGEVQDMSQDQLQSEIARGEPIRVDLIRLLDQGNMEHNIQLKSGDTVYIPLGTQLDQSFTKVYVQGRVVKPGVFDFHPGMTALAACIMAGGFDKFAAPNRALIIRQGESAQEVINIDLDKVQKGKLPDAPLQPGDRIHIPESWL
jgi:polysaccharide export outer membrane protein